MNDLRGVNYCLITAAYRQPGGANRTGWATYAETMAECLRGDGANVTVVVIHEALDTDPALRDQSPGTAHAQLRWVYQISNWLPGIGEGLQLLSAVRRLDREHQFDVIEGPNVAGICWAVALWYRRKFVLRVHTSLVSPGVEATADRTWRRKFKWQLDSFAGRASNLVVTHSAAHAATVAAEFRIPVADIILVPHAVADPGVISPGSGSAILAIAGSAPRKGIDLLLRAFALVHARCPDAELTIVGTTPAELDGMLAAVPDAGSSMRARIRAMGTLSDEMLDVEWQRAGVVVVPSRYESFGLVAVEAMARARAVIASNGGALGEVVGDGGVVVPAEDAQALGTAMIGLLESPERRTALGKAGRTRYEARYRPDALVQRMRDLVARVKS